ncbi:MAG: hypothetical protein ACOC2W_03615 [bacterium]
MEYKANELFDELFNIVKLIEDNRMKLLNVVEEIKKKRNFYEDEIAIKTDSVNDINHHIEIKDTEWLKKML